MQSEYRERFRQYLADRGHLLTPQREAIVDVVLAMRCDFTEDDLRERMRLLNADRVSRSTLYRMLDYLIQAELLERIQVGEEFTFRAIY